MNQGRLHTPHRAGERAIHRTIVGELAAGLLLRWSEERLGRRSQAVALYRLRAVFASQTSETLTHQLRVCGQTVEVGRRLGITGQALETLYHGSLLHDIGKAAVPAAILDKDGPLDSEERLLVRSHPEIGADLIAGIESLAGVAPLVRHHHERFDGRQDGAHPGYPYGLAGEDIPFGARIIAVVDTFDALTSNRCYRNGRSVEYAIEILDSERGRQLDPRVVDAFLHSG